MKPRILIWIVLSTLVPALFAADTPDFAKDVAPLFAKHCLSCHGHDEPDGSLVLERYATLLKGGESGAAIQPGKSSGSLLVRMIESQAKEVMPPGKRKKLDAAEIATIKAWIDGGALGPSDSKALVKELVVPKIVPKVQPRASVNALAYSPRESFSAANKRER